MHTKFNEINDRYAGGNYTDEDGTSYNINPSKEIAFGHGSLFRFNIATGSGLRSKTFCLEGYTGF